MRTSGILTRLILVNAIIFIIANIIENVVVSPSGNPFLNQLALWWVPKVFMTRPWGLISYMFLHVDFPHVFFNMLWLYWMGVIFLEYLGAKRLFGIYIMGGLSGGLLYFICANLFPSLHAWGFFLLGASASVMAIVVAIAVYVPNYTVHLLLFGPVRLKYIALIIFILTSVLDFSMNTGGKVAHIGGALMGYLFTLQMRRGRDLTKGITFITDKFMGLFAPKPKSKLKVTYNKKKVTDEEYNASRVVEQQVIDAILDKISRSGYDSLSKREKEILFQASKKDKR